MTLIANMTVEGPAGAGSPAGQPIAIGYKDGSGNIQYATANASGGTNTVAGAANLATAQITTSNAAGTLAVARPTRRSILIKNTDASITIYIGPATVTSANGMPLKAGESVVVTWVGLIQVIAASGAPVVAIADEYD